MAKMLGNRKSSDVKMLFILLSWTWTKSYPVPYPLVKPTLENSKDVSDNVQYNGDKAFTEVSYFTKVYGDQLGDDNGGILSLTLSDEHRPIESSSSVHVNKNEAVRCGDKGKMNSDNTKGLYIYEFPMRKHTDISDTGKSPDAEEAPKVPSFVEYF